MRVVTKLVRTDFTVARIEVDGDHLVMMNRSDDPMPVKAYVEAADIGAFIKAGFNKEVIVWLLKLVPDAVKRLRMRDAAEREEGTA